MDPPLPPTFPGHWSPPLAWVLCGQRPEHWGMETGVPQNALAPRRVSSLMRARHCPRTFPPQPCQAVMRLGAHGPTQVDGQPPGNVQSTPLDLHTQRALRYLPRCLLARATSVDVGRRLSTPNPDAHVSEGRGSRRQLSEDKIF